MKKLFFAPLLLIAWFANAQSLIDTLLSKNKLYGSRYDSVGLGTAATAPLTVSNIWCTTCPPPMVGTAIHVISQSDVSGRFLIDSYNPTGSIGAIINGRRAKGLANSPTPVSKDDVLMAIVADGYGSAGFHTGSIGGLSIRAAEDFSTSTSAPTYIVFATTGKGTTTISQRAILDSAGMWQWLPYNSVGFLQTDANGRITTSALTSGQIVTALGYTPTGITYPNTTKKYLNGYGVFATFNTDSLNEGSTNLFYTAARFNTSFSSKTTTDLTEGTNLYFTNARTRSALSFTAGSGAFNTTTGVITIPTNNNQITNGAGYITGNQTITLSGDVTGSGATGITTTLANSGVAAGTYNASYTVDAKGRITAALNESINDNPGRSMVTTTSSTGYQISSTRNATVSYEGTFQTTSTIGGPSSITVFLETANTNSTTPSDWTIIARQTNSNTITLAVVLQQVDIEPWSITRKIPAGKYVRIRYGSITGTATATINTEQQEVLN